MGKLIYGVAPAIEIDDRALKHVQAVSVMKLRRGESFAFSWDDEPDVGEDVAHEGNTAHGTIWVHAAASLYFSYDGPRDIVLNRDWLEALMTLANSSNGLRVVPEPSPS